MRGYGRRQTRRYSFQILQSGNLRNGDLWHPLGNIKFGVSTNLEITQCRNIWNGRFHIFWPLSHTPNLERKNVALSSAFIRVKGNKGRGFDAVSPFAKYTFTERIVVLCWFYLEASLYAKAKASYFGVSKLTRSGGWVCFSKLDVPPFLTFLSDTSGCAP